MQASAGNLKRVSLELGGKSPDIIFADAHLESAVPGAGMAVFANSGQICSAGTRLFVERKVYDEFVGRVADFGENLNVGNGVDPDTQIGPLVSEQQLEPVTGYLNVARQEGARAVVGGQRLTERPFAKGYFVPFGLGSGVWRAMSARPIASRKACAPAQCGLIATKRWIRPCRSAATR